MSFYSYLHCWKDFNGMKKPGVAAPGFYFGLTVLTDICPATCKYNRPLYLPRQIQ